MPEDLPARVAVHGSRLDRLEDDLRELKIAVAAGNKDIREVRDIIIRVQGGWKTILGIATVGGGIGAVVAKLLPFIPVK